MTSENFVYWLQGYFEIVNDRVDDYLKPDQVKIIKDHIKLVLDKKTPKYSFPVYSPINKCAVDQSGYYYYYNSPTPPAPC